MVSRSTSAKLAASNPFEVVKLTRTSKDVSKTTGVSAYVPMSRREKMYVPFKPCGGNARKKVSVVPARTVAGKVNVLEYVMLGASVKVSFCKIRSAQGCTDTIIGAREVLQLERVSNLGTVTRGCARCPITFAYTIMVVSNGNPVPFEVAVIWIGVANDPDLLPCIPSQTVFLAPGRTVAFHELFTTNIPDESGHSTELIINVSQFGAVIRMGIWVSEQVSSEIESTAKTIGFGAIKIVIEVSHWIVWQ
jgi:hypothetical protein